MLIPGIRRPGTTQIVTAAFEQGGVPADPETVVAKVLSPRGTLSTYTYGSDVDLTKLAVGSYQIMFTPDTGGRWVIRWEGTFDGAYGSVVTEDDMIVQLSPFEDGAMDAYRV